MTMGGRNMTTGESTHRHEHEAGATAMDRDETEQRSRSGAGDSLMGSAGTPSTGWDRVRWGPVWAGAIVALTTYLVLQLLFFAVGWLTLGILIVSASAYLGVGVALSLGLVGSIMWVAVARLLVMFWDRAVRDTERLAEIQQAVSAWHATQRVRQRERRLRTQFALAVAGPVLSRVVAARGDLTDQERFDARLAEGRLRDELRGADLLNDAVRNAIEAARRRGSVVTVFDEGGFDEIDEERRREIRDELAVVLERAHTGRLIIRSARDPRVAVTVVGRAGSRSSGDDDAVDLWHEIPRRGSGS